MSKKKVLWISSSVPYDTVAHAGGKIHNFYLKQLHKKGLFDLRLLSFCAPREIPKLDLEQYGIENDLVYWRRTGIQRYYWGVAIRFSEKNPFNRYANFTNAFIRWGVFNKLRSFQKEGYQPDVIIMQWTQIVLLLPEIKRIFPSSKFVAIEEDVSFLSYERKFEHATKPLSKFLWSRKYAKLKKLELDSLKEADLVINNNRKDEKLLHDNAKGIHTWCWCPFFQSMLPLKRENIRKDILFYGAMEREENWRSAIWFIENVFYKIKDKEVRFLVAGNRPNPALKSFENDRIKILGFVEDAAPLFQSSLCLAAPLVLGAGVKIKVLEGLSSGIPVLTNHIGIEGIPAEKGVEFFYCEEPEDYVKVIDDMLDGRIEYNSICRNAKDFIAANYDFNKDADVFIQMLEKLIH